MQCIDLWIEHGRIENIGCERLLALIRSSTPEQTPTAEGRVTLGFLTQLLQAHLKFGGLDPRSTTRQDLLDHGMDIRAGSSKDESVPEPMHRAHVLYQKEKTAARVQRGVKLSREERYQELSDLTTEFHGLSASDQAPYILEADSLNAHAMLQQLRGPDEEHAVDMYSTGLGDRLWGFSDKHNPIQSNIVNQVLRRLCGREGPLPGFTEGCASWRREFIKKSFIKDCGAIPKSLKVVYPGSCPELYGGACRTEDAPHWDSLTSAYSSLDALVWTGAFANCRIGSAFRLRGEWANGGKRDIFMLLANRWKGDLPRFCVWLLCEFMTTVADGRCISPEADRLVFEQSPKLLCRLHGMERTLTCYLIQSFRLQNHQM